MGEDPRTEWGLLTVRRSATWILTGYWHIRDLCGYESYPLARARVHVAAATLDSLAKKDPYSQ